MRKSTSDRKGADARARASTKGPDPGRPKRKLIEFDAETWHALHRLSQDSLKSLQDLADEAFRDLLRKHGRPVTLKEALRESARRLPANDPPPRRSKRGA